MVISESEARKFIQDRKLADLAKSDFPPGKISNEVIFSSPGSWAEPYREPPRSAYTISPFLGIKPGQPFLKVVPKFIGFDLQWIQRISWLGLTLRINAEYSRTRKEVDRTVAYWEREIMG